MSAAGQHQQHRSPILGLGVGALTHRKGDHPHCSDRFILPGHSLSSSSRHPAEAVSVTCSSLLHRRSASLLRSPHLPLTKDV
ncbi:hypothetical protein XELAEV_18012390mg [Xenopus laevis]|uniref:Uncharacterized protein n=1 Tax=Xenopus laevis TaxID=8355 RepID=A0A974DMG6_XENLA|nr:hypothetical protein XELAEV_18012390mg [Xenopus laevis]